MRSLYQNAVWILEAKMTKSRFYPLSKWVVAKTFSKSKKYKMENYPLVFSKKSCKMRCFFCCTFDRNATQVRPLPLFDLLRSDPSAALETALLRPKCASPSPPSSYPPSPYPYLDPSSSLHLGVSVTSGDRTRFLILLSSYPSSIPPNTLFLTQPSTSS